MKNNSFTTIKLYSITGKEVRTILNENSFARKNKITWNSDRLNGIFIAKIQTENHIESKKIIIFDNN